MGALLALPQLLKIGGAVILAVLVLAVVVQTARLNNAKRDQLDPKTHVKWKAEYKTQSGLLASTAAGLERCNISVANLGAGLANQNTAILKLQSAAATSADAASRAAQAAFAANDRTAKLGRIAAVKGVSCPLVHDLREASQ
jgi:hypothetical protein